MAISYDNIFGNIAKLIALGNIYFNEQIGLLQDSEGYLTQILGQYNGTNSTNDIEGLSATSEGIGDQLLGIIDVLAGYAQNTLSDFDKVTTYLPLGSDTSLANIFEKLIIQMNLDGETVKHTVLNSVSVGVGANNNSSDSTQILITTVLDGVQSPRAGVAPQEAYHGLPSELMFNDTVSQGEEFTMTCVNDSEHGANEGNESFLIVGGIPKNSNFDFRVQGSGTGPTINVMNGEGIIFNGEFDLFTTANVPDGWTLASGAAGTEIFQDVADFVGPGASALKLKGTGTAATITQDATTYRLNPLQAYRVACWVKGDATIAAGTLTIDFTGTGYSAGASEKISLDHTALAGITDWFLKTFVIVMPKEIPDDLTLQISVASLTANKFVKIDRLALQTINYFGGIGFNIMAGATKFLEGDLFTAVVTVTSVGLIQDYFSKQFGIQLPSSGSPTQADSLVAFL